MCEEAGLFDGEVEVMISDPAENERTVTRIMARLINADKRIAEIKKLYCDGCDNCCGVKCLDCWVDDVMCLIDDAPSVDAVPVVRCGKCKHFRPYEGEEHKGDCAELVGLESCVYEDDFCSYGERKGGDGNG